jgi:hypothetical protein
MSIFADSFANIFWRAITAKLDMGESSRTFGVLQGVAGIMPNLYAGAAARINRLIGGDETEHRRGGNRS